MATTVESPRIERSLSNNEVMRAPSPAEPSDDVVTEQLPPPPPTPETRCEACQNLTPHETTSELSAATIPIDLAQCRLCAPVCVEKWQLGCKCVGPVGTVHHYCALQWLQIPHEAYIGQDKTYGYFNCQVCHHNGKIPRNYVRLSLHKQMILGVVCLAAALFFMLAYLLPMHLVHASDIKRASFGEWAAINAVKVALRGTRLDYTDAPTIITSGEFERVLPSDAFVFIMSIVGLFNGIYWFTDAYVSTLNTALPMPTLAAATIVYTGLECIRAQVSASVVVFLIHFGSSFISFVVTPSHPYYVEFGTYPLLVDGTNTYLIGGAILWFWVNAGFGLLRKYIYSLPQLKFMVDVSANYDGHLLNPFALFFSGLFARLDTEAQERDGRLGGAKPNHAHAE